VGRTGLDLHLLAHQLERKAGITIDPDTARHVGGGPASAAFRVESADGPLLLKLAPDHRADMFAAEAGGLACLRRAHALAVPRVYSTGIAGKYAFLALEWLELEGDRRAAEAELGRRLALQHRVTSEAFGWDRDSTIGATRQPNAWTDNWLEFFSERRLRFQLSLAIDNGLPPVIAETVDRLLEDLERRLGDHRPSPSLLHGDLWGGNWGANRFGTPYVFDPAVYYGDREADLAMTRLFGGFGSAFYEAYAEAWPLPDGAQERTDLYNLYHLLNHFNLFGGGYANGVHDAATRWLRSGR
jgi:protein-ribulosamine 3-kinase